MISKEDAIKIAKAIAKKEKWACLQPFSISQGVGLRQCYGWVIYTNCGSFGMNIRMVIDCESGEILAKSYSPR